MVGNTNDVVSKYLEVYWLHHQVIHFRIAVITEMVKQDSQS